MNLDLRDEKALTRQANGPLGLIATLIVYIITALALILSYSIAEGAQSYTVHQLFQRLPDGEVVAIQDDIMSCYGYDATARHSVNLNLFRLDAWYVELPVGYDYAMYCTDFVPAWVEDHDPGTWADPAMLILERQATWLLAWQSERVPIGVWVCGRIPGGWMTTLCAVVPVAGEVHEDGLTWYVNVPTWVARWHVWYSEGCYTDVWYTEGCEGK